MNSVPEWFFDEQSAVGVDYQNPAVAEAYDARHTQFRDYRQQTLAIIERMQIRPTDVVVDLGCGTGAFALNAAAYCQHIDAVDISPAMLALLQKKAESQKLTNITTHCAGFLTYEHSEGEASVDAIVSMVALHHLPDFWKAVAIERIAKWLRPGGKFYLMDVVFPFAIADYRQEIEQWLGTIRNHGEVAQEAITHIRNEYSTFDWVLEGVFERCGLVIESKNQWNASSGLDYVVVKR